MNIEALQEACLRYPKASEEIKWQNDLVFSVGGKMFCVASLEEPFTASFKVPADAFEEMCNRDGFRPAPYLARAHWVLVSNETKLSKQEWQFFLEQSFNLVKQKLTKKQQIELGLLP